MLYLYRATGKSDQAPAEKARKFLCAHLLPIHTERDRLCVSTNIANRRGGSRQTSAGAHWFEIKSPRAHTSYSVLIPRRQPGDILYQYVTAHISSSLASALSATKKRCSFGSAGAGRARGGGPIGTGRAPRRSNGAGGARDETGPAPGHLRHFFQMFLFITFVPSECTGRVRVLRAECTAVCAAPPALPRTDFQNNRTLTITTSLRRLLLMDPCRVQCSL